MGIWSWLKKSESRGINRPGLTLDQMIAELDGSGGIWTGVEVNAETALKYSAYFSCCKILAESIASLPVNIYKRNKDGSKERVTDNPVYKLLHDAPNDEMTAAVFRETLQGHLPSWGNCYAMIAWNGAGRVDSLWPLRPDRIMPKRVGTGDGRLKYEYRFEDGTTRYIEAEDMIHIPAFGYDGLQGYPILTYGAQAIGLGIGTDKFGAKFFGKGAQLGGILETPQKLKPETVDKLREQFNKEHVGTDNAWKIKVLEQGMSFKTLGVPAREAQFLETRKYQVNEIARLFRIPPHMLADLDRATFSNIEHQSLEFVTYTLTPWVVKWEQEINRKLLGGTDMFCEFNMDGLLRGDISSRYSAYAIGRQWGWLSVNDIRAKENLNPVENGDEYLQPMNMRPVGKQDEPEEESQAEPPDAVEMPENDDAIRMTLAATLADGLGRVLARAGDRIARGAKSGQAVDFAKTYFADERARIIESVCSPLALLAATTGRDVAEVRGRVESWVESTLEKLAGSVGQWPDKSVLAGELAGIILEKSDART